MSTFVTHKISVPLMLDSIITSKTRLRLLIKFFINVGTHGHLRGLAEELGESTNSIRKELNNLAGAGYLHRLGEGNKIDYSANPTHPLFKTLQSIVRTHIGLDTILTSVLERMGQVDQLIVVGDYASGIDSGTIEMIIAGNEINQQYLEQLSSKIQSLIDRKVSFHLKEAWIGKGIVLYDKIENGSSDNEKMRKRQLNKEEFLVEEVTEK